jgi:hypothetical protein
MVWVFAFAALFHGKVHYHDAAILPAILLNRGAMALALPAVFNGGSSACPALVVCLLGQMAVDVTGAA